MKQRTRRSSISRPPWSHSLSPDYPLTTHHPPRSAAEQSLTAWRSLGDAGRAGAAASLLSLGHLVLQLHGIGAGMEEAR